MEELKCFLLGFGSYALSRHSDCSAETDTSRTPSHASASGGLAKPPLKRGRGSPSGAGAAEASPKGLGGRGPSPCVDPAEWLLPALRARLHPAEAHLLSELLPLGEQYARLSAAAQDTVVGRTEGLYPSAVGAAVGRVLELYAADVRQAATPSALAGLRTTYGMAFHLLCDIVEAAAQAQQAWAESPPPFPQGGDRSQTDTPSSCYIATTALLRAIQSFVTNREVPLTFRQSVGVCVWRAVLYTTAHYVAHGVVLHGRHDYFVSVTPAGAATGRATEQHTLHTDLLPAGVSVDLGLLILTAGKERRVLLGEADTQGGVDHLAQLAVGTKDVAAEAVFRAIFNLNLCEGGVLAADELTARVEAARALWSKALWTRVGNTSSLGEHLEALRVVFLCTRGDLWLAFVERCFDSLSGVNSSGMHMTSRRGVMVPVSSASASHRATAAAAVLADGTVSGRRGGFSWATAQRSVSEAFRYAMSVSGLADHTEYERFRLLMAAPQSTEEEEEMYGRSHTRSVEAAGQLLLDRARSIGVRFAPPQGLPLVVSQKAIGYYQRLFSLHVGMRFTTHAMNLTRQLFAGAILANKSPSADLRRAYALFQLLSFLLTTVSHYFQVDVIAMPSAELQEHLHGCKSVEEAKRRHDRFIWRVAEGSFLTEGSEGLHAACRALCECATTLFILCTRYRLNYWAVDGLNRTPIEVAAALTALEARVQQRVVAAFTGHLSTSSRQAERALWARMDFNRFFSYRPSARTVPETGPMTGGPSGYAAMAPGTRWKVGADTTGVSGETTSDGHGGTAGFLQPRRLVPSAAAASSTMSAGSVSPAPQPAPRARSRRRSSSAGATRRARHVNVGAENEEELGDGGDKTGSGGAGGRTVIASPAAKYKRQGE